MDGTPTPLSRCILNPGVYFLSLLGYLFFERKWFLSLFLPRFLNTKDGYTLGHIAFSRAGRGRGYRVSLKVLAKLNPFYLR